jgi:hypothetical protein
MQDYHDFLGEVLISEADLQKRVQELGAQSARTNGVANPCCCFASCAAG